MRRKPVNFKKSASSFKKRAKLVHKKNTPSYRNARGQAIATRPIGQWDDQGVDDMNMSRLDILVKKQQLEEDLASYSQQDKELDQAHFDAIPAAIREKFGFTLKKQSKAGLKNDDLNDDKQPVQKTKLKKAKTPDPDPPEIDEVENS